MCALLHVNLFSICKRNGVCYLTNCIQTVGHHVDVRTRGQWTDALYGGAVLWSQHIPIACRQLLGLWRHSTASLFHLCFPVCINNDREMGYFCTDIYKNGRKIISHLVMLIRYPTCQERLLACPRVCVLVDWWGVLLCMHEYVSFYLQCVIKVSSCKPRQKIYMDSLNW